MLWEPELSTDTALPVRRLDLHVCRLIRSVCKLECKMADMQ